MRIGIDISQIVYFGTGVSVYIENLAKALLEQDSNNSYTLFGSNLRKQGDLESFSKELKKYNKVRSRFYPIPQSILTILWNKFHHIPIEFFSGSVDIFHTSDWLEPPAKAKKVTTIHDLLVYKYPKFMHPGIVANQKLKLSWVKKESERIIVDSKNTKKDVVEILKIEHDRIRVVPLGVHPIFVPQPKEKNEITLKKYSIDGEYILTMGSSEPRKNITRVIEAFKQLPNANTLKLIVIGKHENNKHIQDDQDVTFLQDIDFHDLPSLYAGARCFVSPSLYEGFGFPVLEAMSCGTIVVTSDRGSLKEVAGEAAIIVDPAKTDSILEGIVKALTLSNSSYNEHIQKGIIWSKQFTWEKTAEKTLAVYNELL